MNAITFLRTIAENPDDDTHRLVFADWLEEQGDWRAEYLRLDCRLSNMAKDDKDYAALQDRWKELRSRMSSSWLTVLGRSNIENCEIRFKFRCPQKWDKLSPTEIASIRFCESCRRSVHYCHSIGEARQEARKGNCVAVDLGVARYPGDLSVDGEMLLGVLVDPFGEV